ncbi:monosaccharide ABC transporter substrate-binding protein, CUT2 family [Formivibrio citricus]|uniref:Autoinducer 2-binding protein LsrB n=1 Tax=Formivibrio citricus TaxID=83765 RepID=A0A1I4YD19_9NEIS|nr:substrate-binding domain-containing protein [Formivibrio citricus]SFN35663.1 monosaccharide ABC transporter substrate-binding protein, CUT2 family [Formivibrio citricus]
MSKRMNFVALTGLWITGLLFATPVSGAEKYHIAIMPKLVGIQYYGVVKQGVDAAARELPGVKVTWTGPTQDQVEKQIEMIEKLIPAKPDLIAVAANDPVAIAPVLRKARQAGIRVMSWDGDANFREFFVNLVDFDEFGKQLVESIREETGPQGEIAIVTTTFSAPNQASWIAAIKKHLYAQYPGLKIVDIRPAGESTEEAYRITQDYLKTFPNLKGIIALGVPNVPGVARAIKEAGKTGKVAVVGNSTPNLMRGYLKDGTARKVLLWNAPDHGYLTVYSAYRLLRGEISEGKPFKAGRLGNFTPRKDNQNLQVALPVMVFTRDNVDKHRF